MVPLHRLQVLGHGVQNSMGQLVFKLDFWVQDFQTSHLERPTNLLLLII